MRSLPTSRRDGPRRCDAGPNGQRAWHGRDMTRVRLSTTVDGLLLAQARAMHTGVSDAALVDKALSALISRYRSGDVDGCYAAYDEHPLGEPDESGDLDTFRRAVAAS